MEIRLNLIILGLLLLVAAGVTHGRPASAMDPNDALTRDLAQYEDAFAADSSDPVLAQRLLEAYIEADQPGLAIAAIDAADPVLREQPMIGHRLAQAYELSGSMLDALRTADLATSRCARSLGTSDAPSGTPVPRFACSAREYAILEMHQSALTHMVEWGVAGPEDPRVAIAYEMSMRRAAIAMTD